MSKQSYSKELWVTTDSELAFNAITIEIDKWWTTLSSKAQNVGDKLTVRFGDTTYKVMKVTKAIPDQAIAWEVVEANIDHEDLTKTDEWVGTKIKWEIEQSTSGCKISFLHDGLIPTFECYQVCERGWDYFLESLKDFLNTGKGRPYDGSH